MLREVEGSAPPARSEWLRVERVENLASFAALRGEWNALVAESGVSIFNGWDWIFAWHQRLAPSMKPWVLAARDRDGKLVGLMPLGLEEERVGPVRARRLCFLGERRVGSDYLDVIARPEHREEATRAFASALLERRAEWDVLDLNDFDERSTTPGFLSAFFAEHPFDVRPVERFLCPNESFAEGETFDQFLKRTKRRDNFLRRKKWLQKQDGYRIEITTRPDELTRPLAEFFRLHALRWEEDGGSSGVNGPRVEAFHRDVTQLLAEQGKLRLYTMWVGGKAVASVYGIVDGDTFLYYQSGMDPEWRNKSVGLVLVGATFEDAISLGLRHYDFLRGTEPYKSDWVSKIRKTTGLRVFPTSGTGAWFVRAEDASKAAKGLLKKALPTDLVQKIRVARRKKIASE